MKVLFAVNNESISETIIKRYQQEYKEIISAKNVYYFNAIIKELQRDKTYDRIVISEDLEPFSNNNYEAIDKFIFEKMDSISDEATNQSGNDIPIILICADRRAKSEPLLIKLFGIGVYNAIIGKDRSITTVCELLNRPRGKKEAKAYYRIDSDDVDYRVENEGEVSEIEIQNILNHYRKLGKNEEKYVESFEHIASQYTDSQLRLIAKVLPLNVKAVLEASSPSYQQVVSFGGNMPKKAKPEQNYNDYQKNSKQEKTNNKHQKNNQYIPNQYNLNNNMSLDAIENNLNKNRITEPVIIPSGINTTKVRKIEKSSVQEPIQTQQMVAPAMPVQEQEIDNILEEISMPTVQQENIPEIEPTIEKEETLQVVQPKRRGRPRKVQPEVEVAPTLPIGEEQTKRGRGRPKKVQTDSNNTVQETINNTSQPMETSSAAHSSPVNLFELGEEESTLSQTNNNTTYSDMILPGLDDDSEMYAQEEVENVAPILPQAEEISNQPETVSPEPERQSVQSSFEMEQPNAIRNFGTATMTSVQNTGKYNLSNTDLSGLLTRDKKIVAFVGTSKNGTSFLVNNLAEIFSQKGIKTALLDLTQNRNAYYIYTQNEENLRQTAFSAIANLRKGTPAGIQVNKNLTVYTTLPGENQDINDYANILETLLKTYSLILLDCDFETNYGYFKEAQEIYLVQSLDVLTIQPLTAFLRDLKAKNVLNPERIRIALNKVVRVRSITERTIVGGMAYYNDPAMSFMTELFNKDMVPYCTIPFEEQAYSKYLEGLVNCKISLNGYSKNFMAALLKLASMVYPLIGNGNVPMQKEYGSYTPNNNGNFSNSMNETLNKMKNNY